MSEVKLPHEHGETVQGILSKDISLKEKSKMIYRYSEMVLRRKSRGGAGIGRPKLSESEIERILLDREIELIR